MSEDQGKGTTPLGRFQQQQAFIGHRKIAVIRGKVDLEKVLKVLTAPDIDENSPPTKLAWHCAIMNMRSKITALVEQ